MAFYQVSIRLRELGSDEFQLAEKVADILGDYGFDLFNVEAFEVEM